MESTSIRNKEEHKFPNGLSPSVSCSETKEERKREIEATLTQIVYLNKMMPPGYKFQLTENIGKPDEDDEPIPSSPQTKKQINGKRKKMMSQDEESLDQDESQSKGSLGNKRMAKQHSKKGQYEAHPSNGDEIEYEMKTKSKIHVQEPLLELKVSQRQKKPTNFKDYGFVEKETRPRGRPSHSVQQTREAISKCEKLLMMLKKHPHGDYFSRLPDKNSKLHRLLSTPDYIDLTIIENNFRAGQYSTTDAFLQDIAKVWTNSQQLKSNEQGISQKALELKLFCDEQAQGLAIPENQSIRDGTLPKQPVTPVQPPPPVEESPAMIVKEQQQTNKMAKKQKDMKEIQMKAKQEAQEAKSQQKIIPQQLKEMPVKDQRKDSKSLIKEDDILDRPMSYVDRQSLGHRIHYLSKEQLLGIVPLIQEPQNQMSRGDTLEFDLKTLSDRKCREIEKYVNACLEAAGQVTQQAAGVVAPVPPPVLQQSPSPNLGQVQALDVKKPAEQNQNMGNLGGVLSQQQIDQLMQMQQNQQQLMNPQNQMQNQLMNQYLGYMMPPGFTPQDQYGMMQMNQNQGNPVDNFPMMYQGQNQVFNGMDPNMLASAFPPAYGFQGANFGMQDDMMNAQLLGGYYSQGFMGGQFGGQGQFGQGQFQNQGGGGWPQMGGQNNGQMEMFSSNQGNFNN